MNEKNIDFYNFNTEDAFERNEKVKATLIFGELNQPIPSYTILIPTYQRPELLEEALLSALKQRGCKDYEIMIVEHGQENDDTEKMLQKYKKDKKIFYYKLSEWVPGGNWNKGIQLVRTKWFTLLCDDDLLYPNYIYAVDNILKEDNEIEALAPLHEYFYYDFAIRKVVDDPKITCIAKTKRQKTMEAIKNIFTKQEYQVGKFIMDNFYTLTGAGNPSGVMYKTEHCLQLGGWNIDFQGFSDIVLNANYILKYNMYYMTEILAKRRFWDGAGTSRKDIRLSFIFWLKHFFESLEPHLKVLDFEDRYTKLLVCNALINEWDLQYEDIKEYNFDIPKDYCSKAALTEFKRLREKKLKQLAEVNPPITKYYYNRFFKKLCFGKIDKEKDKRGVNSYVDFVEYFEKNRVQKKIDKLGKKYKDKKVILYGGGLFTEILLENYDLSAFNIEAIADLQFDAETKIRGYEVINPETLKDRKFDVLLLSIYKDFMVLEFLKKKLFKGFKPKFKIESLIKYKGPQF